MRKKRTVVADENQLGFDFGFTQQFDAIERLNAQLDTPDTNDNQGFQHADRQNPSAVSYTHLTLPTSDLV